MKKKVAIIGSGIAGLTLANLLKTNPGFEFILYEKEDTEDVFSQIEEKTRYFNEVKTIIRDLHSDERYPRGG